ncbi:hypothetical protein BVI434_690008 [Burkholderia vietnamiensis]|nr:hypothetical protein BVI434_690008 [Burkholderia vietnamiensis]
MPFAAVSALVRAGDGSYRSEQPCDRHCRMSGWVRACRLTGFAIETAGLDMNISAPPG